jgi:GMP synthase PP-ATPase subunit
MTWQEIHEHENLDEIKYKFSDKQAALIALANSLDAVTAALLMSNSLNAQSIEEFSEQIRSMEQPSQVAEAIENAFDLNARTVMFALTYTSEDNADD